MSSSIPPASSVPVVPVNPPPKVAPVGGATPPPSSNIGPAVEVSFSNTAHLTDDQSGSDTK